MPKVHKRKYEKIDEAEIDLVVQCQDSHEFYKQYRQTFPDKKKGIDSISKIWKRRGEFLKKRQITPDTETTTGLSPEFEILVTAQNRILLDLSAIRTPVRGLVVEFGDDAAPLVARVDVFGSRDLSGWTQHVKAGDLLATIDIEAIRQAGYSMVTPIVVTNTADYLDVIAELTGDAQIKAGEPLLTLIAESQEATEVNAHAVSE